MTSVKQVSSTRAQILADHMHITSVRDLLSCYPHRYVDMSKVVSVVQAELGQRYTIAGNVYEVKRNPRSRVPLVEITLTDETGVLLVSCFNQPWLLKQLSPGMSISVSGKVEFSYGFKRMTNPLVVVHDPSEDVRGIVLPIHPSTAKLSRTMVRRLALNALEQTRGLQDPLPLSLRTKYKLYSRYQALRAIHAPRSLDDARQGRRRMRYEELFFLELELIAREQERIAGTVAFHHPEQGSHQRALKDALPFKLTEDQQSAIKDISGRMAKDVPMNHLLLGDVGTGKTMVAAFALAACADLGTQAFMLGPTEVLVRQYASSLGPLFDQAGISWAVLTGSTPAPERAEMLVRFAAGEITVLFGTHALFEDDVQPKECSLICIDEQQRFGVDQRKRLVDKAPGADLLSMTATPIPRSLALTLYGGLSLSCLKAAPAKQGGRTTTVCHFSEEGVAYDALRAALERGEQAYVICPLIGLDFKKEEGKDRARQDQGQEAPSVEYAAIEWDIEHDEVDTSLSAATKHAKILQEQIVPQAHVGLLHGKMPAEEKDQVMGAFRQGEIDVLVSTTVVEVGVDVPQATVMIIEDADRFGLAQLHQLRGRVGRGTLPGQVFLVSRSRAPQALERLKVMEQTDDGFSLSEYDLSQRREGDIFGNRQHGTSPLSLVNVIRDKALIEAAFADAWACFGGEGLSADEQALLKRELAVHYQQDQSHGAAESSKANPPAKSRRPSKAQPSTTAKPSKRKRDQS